jgi:hypothetical protein
LIEDIQLDIPSSHEQEVKIHGAAGISPELEDVVPEFLIFGQVLRIVGRKHVSLGGENFLQRFTFGCAGISPS